jgi:hypothetical protein
VLAKMSANEKSIFLKYLVLAVAVLIISTAFAEVTSFTFKEDKKINENKDTNYYNILETFYERFLETYSQSDKVETKSYFESEMKKIDNEILNANLGIKYKNNQLSEIKEIKDNNELETTDDFGEGYYDLLKIIVEKPSNEGNSGDDGGDNNDNLILVDKVYNAKGNDGTLLCPVKVESVPLNVIGHANINVLKGQKYIEERPVFDGLCLGDKAAFAVISMSLTFMLKTVIILKLIGFTFNSAFKVAKGIVKGY